MISKQKTPLAIDGGEPVRKRPFPTINDASGRTLGSEELDNLRQVIDSGKLFRFAGNFVSEFERDLASLLNMKHAVAVSSGTAAIHTALATLNLNPGDEVIVPPITDMGTIAPVLALNLVPVFADVDERTLTLDPESVTERITERTRAIVAVHLAGNMCDMDVLKSVAGAHSIRLVEDCAQAYLSADNGRLSGTIGDIAAFSLQQSKHVTAGDGGAVVTSDDDLARRAAMFMDKGWDRARGGRHYILLGLNYRMNELTGAVAAAQIKKVEGVVQSRRESATALSAAIRDLPGVVVPYVRPGVQHSWWFYPMLWDQAQSRFNAQEAAAAMQAEGIPASYGYIGKPIFDNPFMQERKTYGDSTYPWGSDGCDIIYRNEDVPRTCRALERLIVLPINENFTAQDVADMAEGVRKVALTGSLDS